MALTLTKKIWKAKRPSSAKDSGVADALEDTEKHCSKPIASMTAAEVASADTAVGKLDEALKTAKGKVSDKKEALAFEPLVKGWRTECADYKTELTKRTYALRVDIVAKKWKESFDNQKDRFDDHYAKAKAAHQALARDGAPPSDKDILSWMSSVRDLSHMVTKEYIPKMSVPEAKLVKVVDVPVPNGVKDVKPKIVEMTGWCTDFAKAAKRGAREAGAGVGDTNAADKALKDILADYDKVEARMKPVIKKAEALALETKALAARIKVEIERDNRDATLFKGIGADIKRLATECDGVTNDVKAINSTWRENSGAMATKIAAMKKQSGFDDKRHGTISVSRMQSNMMGVRRATGPLTEAVDQVARARRLMQASSAHRGYV